MELRGVSGVQINTRLKVGIISRRIYGHLQYLQQEISDETSEAKKSTLAQGDYRFKPALACPTSFCSDLEKANESFVSRSKL